MVFGCLILTNFFMALPTIILKCQPQIKHEVQTSATNSWNEELPNIYYFVLDEYASFDFIEKYYNYNNNDFMNFLKIKGFYVSDDSYNDSIFTATVLSNIHALDYISTDDTPEKNRIFNRKNSKIFELLHESGYVTKSVETDSVNTDNAIPCDIPFQIDKTELTSFEYSFWEKTLLYPFIKKNMDQHFRKISSAFSFIETPESPRGLFTYGHIVCPHEPFVVDENGREISPKDRANYINKNIYLGQYKYVTKRMESVIQKILEENPDCIIILQSDHSSRFQFSQQLWNEYSVNYDDIKSILNAVYYRNVPFDKIKGQSGLNTIRLVLSELLDTILPVVEVPAE